MNYAAATLAELIEIGDAEAARHIARRASILNRLKLDLEKHRNRPPAWSKRGETMRARDERIILKKIKALELGLPLSCWMDVELF